MPHNPYVGRPWWAKALLLAVTLLHEHWRGLLLLAIIFAFVVAGALV